MDVKKTPVESEIPKRPAEGKNSYRRAIERGDWDLLRAAFAPDAKIFVPPRIEPIVGRDAIVGFLNKIVTVFGHGGDFGFTHELDDAAGNKAIVFAATVPGLGDEPPIRFTTTDLFEFDEHDRITTMSAMTRPIQALLLLRKHGIE